MGMQTVELFPGQFREIYVNECNCGSGLAREEIRDARGIFVTYACSKCKKEKLLGYRPEIFSNPNYFADEEIEPDIWFDE
jgi:hypothetical protein